MSMASLKPEFWRVELRCRCAYRRRRRRRTRRRNRMHFHSSYNSSAFRIPSSASLISKQSSYSATDNRCWGHGKAESLQRYNWYARNATAVCGLSRLSLRRRRIDSWSFASLASSCAWAFSSRPRMTQFCVSTSQCEDAVLDEEFEEGPVYQLP